MPDEAPKQTPQQEIREKLKHIRASYTRAKKLIGEVEKNHTAFTRIRDALNDKENGVEANFKWLSDRRDQINTILTDANSKLGELEVTANSIQNAVEDITNKYTSFDELAKQVFDKDEGLAAVLRETRKLKTNTDKLAKKINENSTTSQQKLDSINDTTRKVAEAYNAFLEKKKLVDDEESGLDAQLRRATEDADSVQAAKTKAESALVSVTKFKEQSDELVAAIGDSKKTVESYQKESKTLTDDIRNTLNKATQFTLSQALHDRTERLGKQMRWWAIFQGLSIIGLVLAVGVIFYALFIHSNGNTDVTSRLQDGPTLMSVISKFLFTTPLIFAVYFTTSNFRHVRDLRDRYAWKETVAKNFQNYIKLVKDEFQGSDQDKRYEEERFKFSMETIRSIYLEPNPTPKKRKYNFSFYNKIFQAKMEEEDLIELKEAVTDKVKEEIKSQVEDSPPKTETVTISEQPPKPIPTKTTKPVAKPETA